MVGGLRTKTELLFFPGIIAFNGLTLTAFEI